MLVVDFGGGTFDVSILKVDNGCFEVIQVKGDPHLGGRDIDLVLRKYFAELIKQKWDRKLDNEQAQKLLKMSEELKVASNDESFEEELVNQRFLIKKRIFRILIRHLFSDINETITINDEKFNELVTPLFNKAIAVIKSALECAKIKAENINEVNTNLSTYTIYFVMYRFYLLAERRE